MFNIIDYIGDEYKEGCVFVFMDGNKDPVMFLNKDIFDSEIALDENYKLAVDMGCDFLCVIVPFSLTKGTELFSSFDDSEGLIKFLSIKPSLNLKESGGYSLLMVIPTKEDSISLMLLNKKTIIYQETLISELPIKIGD